MARVATALLLAVGVQASSSGGSGQLSSASCDLDLREKYFDVFITGNRNAASHLWTSYILDHASGCDADTVEALFRGFCSVSGSLGTDDPRKQYQVSLRKVTGGEIEGISHHCCWPCICDLQENVWVDTMTFATSDGTVQRNALVFGDPCNASDAAEALAASYVDPFSGGSTSLSMSAPEVQCDGGKLRGATFSDHGFPIIGMFFDLESAAQPQQAELYGSECEARKAQGYNSGMGLIFHKVALINPISEPISLAELPELEAAELAQLPELAMPTSRPANGSSSSDPPSARSEGHRSGGSGVFSSDSSSTLPSSTSASTSPVPILREASDGLAMGLSSMAAAVAALPLLMG